MGKFKKVVKPVDKVEGDAWKVDPDVTVVIDLDQICFVVAAACEERLVQYTNSVSFSTGLFKNRADFKKFMQGIDFEPNTFDVEDIQKPEKISFAINTLKSRIKNILKQVKCSDENVELYIGGKDNFREKLPLPLPYKHNRKDTIKPVLLQELRDYCINYLGAIVINGQEVDDVISTRMYEGYKSKEKVVGVSFDKDNKMTSGWIFVPDVMSEPFYINGFGDLYLDTDKKNNPVKGYGRKWLYFQCMIGDPTDGLNPRDIYEQLHGKKPRFGEKTCYTLLTKCKTDKECLEVICNQYKKWYGVDKFTYKDWQGGQHEVTWVDILELYFLGVWMRQSWEDKQSMKKILSKMDLI